MAASRLNPKLYKGREVSGGYIYKNRNPKGASSPVMRGKVYVAEPGWHWVSIWNSSSNKAFQRVALDGFTDEQALLYCQPSGNRGNGATPASDGHEVDSDPEIPF